MAGRKKLLKAISSKPSGRALPWCLGLFFRITRSTVPYATDIRIP